MSAASETIPIHSEPPDRRPINPREWDDLFAALAAPFEPEEVKSRKQGGKDMRYITARTAMTRLDAVLGAANWWDDYTPGHHSVICRLTIRLPDGSMLTKVDAGAQAPMQKPGDSVKAGFSDAFKRAAAKYGVARYLYADAPPEAAGPQGGAQRQPRAPAQSQRSRQAPRGPGQWIERQVALANAKWRESAPEGMQDTDIVNVYEMENHLANAFVAAGLAHPNEIATGGKRDRRKVLRVINQLWSDDPQIVTAEVRTKLLEKLREARELDPDEASDEWEEGRE